MLKSRNASFAEDDENDDEIENNFDEENVVANTSMNLDDIASDEEDYLDSIIKRPGGKGKKRVASSAPIKAKKAKVHADAEDIGAAGEALDSDYMGNIANGDKMETGHVVRIYVENFMCHRKLTVDFGRHVNFVTGQNGSGKSAIVAAIQLCLGSTARDTGRGTSLASCIREGSDGPAIIRVTLLNAGADAYKPEEYGDKITIERRIHKGSSANTYRLISGLGGKGDKVISQDRRELNKILTQFNIYVGNPVCVLTQEESKKFIQGKETDKYTFFMKATGLERTREVLKAFSEDVDQAKTKIPAVEESVQAKVNIFKQYRAELAELEQLSRFEEEIKINQAKLLWLDVHHVDAAVEEFERDVDIKKEDLSKALDAYAEAEKGLESDESVDVVREQMKQLEEEQAAVLADIEHKSRVALHKQKEMDAISLTIKNLTAARNETADRMKRVKAQIREMQERMLATSEGQERVLMEQIAARTKTIQELQGKDRDLKQLKRQQIVSLEELQSEENRINQQGRSLTTEVNGLREQMRDLQQGGDLNKSRALMFGKQVPTILNQINRAKSGNRFRGEVIGPLGMAVKIKDGFESYEVAVERVLGKWGSAFMVTCQEDEQVLYDIIKGCGASMQHSILRTHPEARYNIPTLTDANAASDAMVIENDLVYNALVDNAGIARRILVLNEQEAMNRYITRTGNKFSWRNSRIAEAITKDGTTLIISNGNFAEEANRFPPKNCLAKDSAEVINRVNERIESLERQLQDIQHDAQASRQQVAAGRADLESTDRGIRPLLDHIRRESKAKSDLEAELQNIEQAQQLDTSPFEEELQDLERSLDSINGQYEDKVANHTLAKSEHTRLNQDKQQAERGRETLSNRLGGLEAKLNNFINRLANAKNIVIRATKVRDAAKEKLALAEKALDEKQVEREELVAEVSTRTERLIKDWDGNPPILTRNDTDSKLRSKIKAAEEKLEKEKKNAGLQGRTIESVTHKLNIAHQQKETAIMEYETFNTNVEMLVQDLSERKKRWGKLLKKYCGEVATAFDVYMSNKGQSGDVLFNHEECTLRLRCQTDNMDEKTLRDDVRQLSGGERSYATLCLLLALGKVTECPFRIMDEYDVFLDEVSRKITLNRLLAYADEPSQRARQLIIVTPHTLQGIQATNKVRIKRMAPPVRATSSGLQQTTLDM